MQQNPTACVLLKDFCDWNRSFSLARLLRVIKRNEMSKRQTQILTAVSLLVNQSLLCDRRRICVAPGYNLLYASVYYPCGSSISSEAKRKKSQNHSTPYTNAATGRPLKRNSCENPKTSMPQSSRCHALHPQMRTRLFIIAKTVYQDKDFVKGLPSDLLGLVG